jgi:hypothetical protein
LREAEKLSSLVIQETGHGTFWVDKTALAEWLVGEVESDKFLPAVNTSAAMGLVDQPAAKDRPALCLENSQTKTGR